MLQLAVAVKEPEYIRRLADYARDSPIGTEWRLTGFTSEASLRQYLRGGYRVDLLAVQPEFLEAAEERRADRNAAPVALLVRTPERGGDESRTGAAGVQVRQFQPLPELFGELLAIYREAAGGGRSGDGGGASPAVVGICSAVGGMGKTTLAVHLAHAAEMRRKRAFYLNLELWNASGLHFGGEQEDAMPRLLYALEAEPARAGVHFARLKRRHPDIGADFLPAAPSPGERLALSPEIFGRLADTVLEGGEYGLLVVDMDGLPDELFMAALARCTRILWLVSDDPAARRKTDILFRYARLRWGEAFFEAERRMGFVTLERRPGEEAGGLPALPFVPEWAEDGLASPAQAPPAYRSAVQRLLEAVTGEEAGDERRRGNDRRDGYSDAAGAGAEPHRS